MAGGAHSQGVLGRLLIEPGSGTPTYDASSLAFEFLYEDLTLQRRIGGNRGLRGTLARAQETQRELSKIVRGRVAVYLTPRYLERLCETLMGWTESGPSDTWTPNDTLPYFSVLVDRDSTNLDTGVFSYTNCMLDWWVISARAPTNQDNAGEPEMCILTMGIIGSDEDDVTVSYPVSPPSIPTTKYTDDPYVFSDTDGAVTLLGTAWPVEELQIYGQHKIQAKYANSLTAHSLRPTEQIFGVKARLPWNTTTETLHVTSMDGADGDTIVFTNAEDTGINATFTFGNLINRDKSPNIPGKRQIEFNLDLEAFSTGSTKPLVITNDHTPT